MKNLIYASALGVLIFAGLLMPIPGKSYQPNPAVSLGEVLSAHNVPPDPAALSAFAAQAVKYTFYDNGDHGKSPGFFERKVSVSFDGEAFTYRKSHPLGIRDQLYMFDGRAAYSALVEKGEAVEAASQSADSQIEAARFSARTFGLVWMLKHISSASAEAVYLGETAQKQEMFEVEIADDRWTLYTDRQRLIRKLEKGNKTIEYADYRSVEGVWLPFVQRLYLGGRLVYELVFTEITLDPAFSPDGFTREALMRDNRLNPHSLERQAHTKEQVQHTAIRK